MVTVSAQTCLLLLGLPHNFYENVETIPVYRFFERQIRNEEIENESEGGWERLSSCLRGRFDRWISFAPFLRFMPPYISWNTLRSNGTL